ncbi:MAG: Gfo/Idh/MocA family oxidoreductase [Sedimentisphaerales bacterium]|nr:Gfo/Idh/MocA family oxidoreductase [Sedimentisphaerales bacterium]
MEQLTQQLKSGEIVTQELPWPQVGPGKILVRNHYSLISPGTEGSTVKAARKNLIGKAMARPQQVKQVVEALKSYGPVQTYRAVMKKLDAYSPLGYSCAGEVIEVGASVAGFRKGDKVACAGIGYANHAEIVCVPRNLCVKLAPDANLLRACYNTLGAIALQGIRQADLRLGESCAVIGLGLLGQLTCLMLRASGVKVIGIDVDEKTVQIAEEHCCDKAWIRQAPEVKLQIEQENCGLGVDAVIITAGTDSLDPINFAGEIVRKKGRVVVVGAVPTGFERNPHWYRKELELKMSCSYGPGRYDRGYEEAGSDYPFAYVRWTENRNMQAFQELVYSERIHLDYLSTHVFRLEDAPKAYNMIVNRSEPFLGVVLKYDVSGTLVQRKITVKNSRPCGKVNIAFIGAGSYAQGNLLPYLPGNDKDIVCKAVLTDSGTTSKRVAERFGFEFCTSNLSDILDNDEINTVFIATRHNTHSEFVKTCLAAGKHCFVEKPLCLRPDELEEIQQEYHRQSNKHLLVGFNRRFSPHAIELKRRLGSRPSSMMYRINAGSIAKDSWIQDKETGGGRIVGEVCHFIDLLMWLSDSLIISVHAVSLPDPDGFNDTVSINLAFENGSIGTICYFANGARNVPKEYLEVYSSGLTGMIHDFRGHQVFHDGKSQRRKTGHQDKGQSHMISRFLDRLKAGGKPIISPSESFLVMKACFAVEESIRTQNVVSLYSDGSPDPISESDRSEESQITPKIRFSNARSTLNTL